MHYISPKNTLTYVKMLESVWNSTLYHIDKIFSILFTLVAQSDKKHQGLVPSYGILAPRFQLVLPLYSWKHEATV